MPNKNIFTIKCLTEGIMFQQTLRVKGFALNTLKFYVKSILVNLERQKDKNNHFNNFRGFVLREINFGKFRENKRRKLLF